MAQKIPFFGPFVFESARVELTQNACMEGDPPQADYLQLWENVQALFCSLPEPNSSYKRELVHVLLPGISRQGQMHLSCIHAESTLSRYIHEDVKNPRLEMARYREGVARNVSGRAIAELVVDLKEKYAAAKSGDKTVVIFLSCSILIIR
jgi:hypothetical protein